MTTKLLRYASLGLTVALAGAAQADTMYMFSGKDGGVYFGDAPSAPRYSARTNSHRLVALRHPNSEAPDSGSSDYADKSRYDLLVDHVARRYQVDSALLHAVISVESSYNPKAYSPAGAAGLMQLMPATAKRYGVEDLFDPEQNLRAGAKYLRDLLSTFGSDLRLALAAYHAGEGAVARHQNTIPPFQATVEYVAKVLEHYHRYRNRAPR